MPTLRQKCRTCELIFDVECPFPPETCCPKCRTPLIVKSSNWDIDFEVDRRLVLGLAAVVCLAVALMAFWIWKPAGKAGNAAAGVIRIDPGQFGIASANPEPARPEVMVMTKTPSTWKDAAPAVGTKAATEPEEQVDGQAHVSIVNGREVVFTPVPSAFRPKDQPASELARVSAVERVQFLKANLGAVHVRNQVYEVATAPAKKRFFKLTPCVIGDDPGNLMIYGESPEDVEKAAEKVHAEAK